MSTKWTAWPSIIISLFPLFSTTETASHQVFDPSIAHLLLYLPVSDTAKYYHWSISPFLNHRNYEQIGFWPDDHCWFALVSPSGWHSKVLSLVYFLFSQPQKLRANRILTRWPLVLCLPVSGTAKQYHWSISSFLWAMSIEKVDPALIYSCPCISWWVAGPHLLGI